MASLIQFLEAARTVWRWVVLVAGLIALYSAYQYQNHQPNLFSGDDFDKIFEATRENTDRFFTVTFDRILGRNPRNPIGAAGRAAAAQAGPETPNINQRVPAAGSPTGRTASNAQTSRSESRPPERGLDRAVPAGTVAAASPVNLASTDKAADTDSDPRVRLAFRRFASQFCRATRSLAMYYSDRVNGPNGDPVTRVGSGVRFPSIDRLTGGRERSLAEKELEVRLRCDYELAYGAGGNTDPKRPAFEQWRQATLERQYGETWTRIDLSHIPTPDDPMSRGEWYVYTPASQE